MKLVVGLGNPGGGYKDTFHNVGFNALDILAARFGVEFSYDKTANADLAESGRGENRIIFCKPTTYMNLSGDAVSHIARYYKIPPENILVIYDDIDIGKGTVRARTNGSAGTHNGMRDIVAKLGSQNFARVRIGTGFKPNYMGLADYVLSHFTAADKAVLDLAYVAACEFAEKWLKDEPWQDLTVVVKN